MVNLEQFIRFMKYDDPPKDIVTHVDKNTFKEIDDPSKPLAMDDFNW